MLIVSFFVFVGNKLDNGKGYRERGKCYSMDFVDTVGWSGLCGWHSAVVTYTKKDKITEYAESLGLFNNKE